MSNIATSIEAGRAFVNRASEIKQWHDIPKQIDDLFWEIASVRPDFEELPGWLNEAPGVVAPDHRASRCAAALSYYIDVVRKVGERYGTADDQKRAAARVRALCRNRTAIDIDRAADFLLDSVDHLIRFNDGVVALPIAMDSHENAILIGRHSKISFHRTLRVPEDGGEYPLPAGFGMFPICRVEDFADRVPEKWLREGGFFIPLYQREALFLQFEGVSWRPTICKVGVGRVNAVTGKPIDLSIRAHEQDYVVVPDQRWLDGINSGNGSVSQFVAMPLGQGYTIEAQVTDEEIHGGFQLVLFDPKAGRFPERDPDADREAQKTKESRLRRKEHYTRASPRLASCAWAPAAKAVTPSGHRAASEMGIGAGGTIRQQILEDEYGAENWSPAARREVAIHIVNSTVFQRITGKKPPPTPISARAYSKQGIPWYSFYDETVRGLGPANALKRILPVGTIDRIRGLFHGASQSAPIRSDQIVRIRTPRVKERVRLQIKRADSALAAGRFSQAVRDSSRAIDLENENAKALLIRALANAKLGHFADAEADATLCLKAGSESPEALAIRAFAGLRMGEHKLAREDADAALEKEPDNETALCVRAELHLLAGHGRLAAADAAKVLAINPSHPDALLVCGKASKKRVIRRRE